MAFIRPYETRDFDAAAHICRATLPPSLSASPCAHRLAPYIWTHPYTLLSPSTCHVLDDGAGRAVGYCIGCPDVFLFVASYDRYVREILDPSNEVSRPRNTKSREPWLVTPVDGQGQSQDVADTASGEVNEQALLQMAHDAGMALTQGRGDVWEARRGTMHIDLLEDYQGRGWGRRLIEAFVESLKAPAEGEEGPPRGKPYGKGIVIGIAGDNAKVVPFYEKCGFRLEPSFEKHGGIWMVRDLE